VPIIDELLDELGNARWFSKLDLCSRFHQILLKPSEEFKTAFQTHFGQFEFKVIHLASPVRLAHFKKL